MENIKSNMIEGHFDFFDKLIEDSLLIKFIVRSDTSRIVYANNSACKFYGYSKEEFEGLYIRDICLLPSNEITIELSKIPSQEKNHFVLRHRLKSGEVKDVEIYSRTILIGGQEHLYSLVLDITERKRLEEINSKNQERFKRLTKLIETPYKSITELLDHALKEAIDLSESRFGFLHSYDEEKSEFIFNIASSEIAITEENYNKISLSLDKAGCWAEAITKRSAFIINTFNNPESIKSDNNFEINRFLSIPIFSENKIVAIAGFANKTLVYDENDIEQLNLLLSSVWKLVENFNFQLQLQISQRLAEDNEKKFRHLFENLEQGFILCQIIYDSESNPANYRIINTNKAFENITGFIKESVIGKYIDEVLPQYSSEWSANLETAIKEGFPMHFEKHSDYFKKDLDIIIYTNNKEHLTILFKDITEKKKIEKEMVVAKNKAEESDRLKTAFLQNISHEIRTPLNAILGFSDLMSKVNINPEKKDHFAKIINTSARQLLSIVTDIITISSLEAKQEKANYEPTFVNEIIESLYSYFKTKAENQNISLKVSTPLMNSDALIITDRTKLTQILTNLLNNALKFTTQGFIEMGYTTESEKICFFVKDTGIGIPKEIHSKIFERFRQADLSINRKYGGTGLGLSISKEYAELIDGNMWVESEPGEGSCFYLQIPFTRVHKAEKRTEMEFTNLKPFRILIAEDDDINFDFLLEVLSESHFEITRAKNGLEVIEFAMKDENFNLILMDIKMPLMDGYKAAQKIKSALPNLKIIAQTAYALNNEKEKFEQDNTFDAYLTKPICIQELKHTIAEISKNIEQQTIFEN